MGIDISEEVFSAAMKSGIVIVAALVVNSLLRSLVKVPHKLNNRRGRTYAAVLKNVISVAVVFVALYALFSIWNIDIAPLLASAGIIGVIVGIGSRSIFEDVFAGVFLVSQSRIAQGDYVVLGNGIEGTVESIGIKNTTLISSSGAYTIVPNGQIKQVTNNAFGRAQIFMDIPVKVGQNPDTILSAVDSVLATFSEDSEYRIMRNSKVIGVNKIDRAYIVTVMLVTEGSMRGKIEPVFNYRLIKAFDRRKLKFADSSS